MLIVIYLRLMIYLIVFDDYKLDVYETQYHRLNCYHLCLMFFYVYCLKRDVVPVRDFAYSA